MGDLQPDWPERVARAYASFGVRRFIPDIPEPDLPDKNPEFEKEHPRKEEGHGPESGRFVRKPGAELPKPDPRATLRPYSELNRHQKIDRNDQVAIEAADVMRQVLERHGLDTSGLRFIGDGHFKMTIEDLDGYAGSADRRYEGNIAHHNAFFLVSKMQGQGIGTEMQEALEELYRRHGIDTISLIANDDVGGYAWAKLGYMFASEQIARNILELAELTAAGFSKEQRGKILRLRQMIDTGVPAAPALLTAAMAEAPKDAPDAEAARALAVLRRRFDQHGIPPTPAEIAKIGRKKGDTMWFGKNFMLGKSWGGIKRL